MYRLTSGDLEDLGRQTNGTLDAKFLVLGAVDQISRDYEREIRSVNY